MIHLLEVLKWDSVLVYLFYPAYIIVPSESIPLEPDMPVVAEAQAVSNEDSSVGEAETVADEHWLNVLDVNLKADGDLPPISPAKKDLTVNSNAAMGHCHS